ncbi:hypothetical protein MMC08_000145 [Hypocenomyce scalaris]|nr:hypothetical protein [Hypocenomyce scalaris]
MSSTTPAAHTHRGMTAALTAKATEYLTTGRGRFPCTITTMIPDIEVTRVMPADVVAAMRTMASLNIVAQEAMGRIREPMGLGVTACTILRQAAAT